MRDGLVSLALLCILCLVSSSCGHSEGSSAIVGSGPGGAAEGGGGGGGGGTSGTLKWSTSIKGTPEGTQTPVILPPFISSPAIAPDGTVYVGSDDHFLYALRPDGTIKWTYETGNSLFASPAVGSDGTIYIGSEDRQIYAINPDGTLKWIVPTVSAFTSSAAIGADGTIYIAGTNHDLTVLSCVSDSSCASITSQKCVQNSDCPADSACVAVQGGGSFCAASTHQACGPNFSPCPTGQTCVPGLSTSFTVTAQQANFFAITDNGTTGTIKWQDILSGVVNSSPALASDGKTLYIGANGDLVIDRSNPCDLKSPYPRSNANFSFPVNGHLYAINTSDGILKWDFKTLGQVDSSPAIGADGTVYVGSKGIHKFCANADCSTLGDVKPSVQGFIYSITDNGTIGTLNCIKDLLGDVNSSPAIGVDGTIYVGADDNHVWALPPISSPAQCPPPPKGWAERWVSPTKDHVRSSPALALDGTIYIGSNDGKLYAFNPDDGEEKLHFESTGSVNSSPSIGLDGTIYFASSSGNGDGVNSSILSALVGSSGKLAQTPWPKFRRDLPNTGRQ